MITEQRDFRSSDVLVKLSRYEYDKRGHHTKEWVYELRPESTGHGRFKVDVDGREFMFDRTNGLPSTVYTYDSHGNWVKAVVTRISEDGTESSRRVTERTYRKVEYYR